MFVFRDGLSRAPSMNQWFVDGLVPSYLCISQHELNDSMMLHNLCIFIGLGVQKHAPLVVNRSELGDTEEVRN